MLQVLLLIAAVAVLAVAGLLVVAATRPPEFRIARSVIIQAAPEAPFAHVEDFHAWEHWSPWAKMDPAMRQTFEGPARGVGAAYAWAGNSKVGEGRMQILESEAPRRLRLRLEFLKPFAATNDVEFTFVSEGSSTRVTWTMTGRNGLMGRVFALLFNMDRMVGKDFEKGLAALRGRCEGG